MTLLRSVARPMLASMFVSGGVDSLRNPQALVPAAQPVVDGIVPLAQQAGVSIPTDPETLVRINGAIHVAAGVMLASGRLPRLSALALATTMVPSTVFGHPFWKAPTPSVRADDKVHFFKNVSMIGGLLMATLDPDPHKKVMVLRAKDAAVEASGNVRKAALRANQRAEKAAKEAAKQSRRQRRQQRRRAAGKTASKTLR